MYAIPIIPTSLINFVIGLVAIPLYIRYALHKDIIDVPNHRSSHVRPTPRGGGVVLVISTVFIALSYTLFEQDAQTSKLPFVFTCLGVAILGFIDDIKELPSTLRLGIQFALGISLFFAHSSNLVFVIINIQCPLWLAAIGGTIWLVGCLNIYNFMDGIDGIATLQGIAASLGWIVVCANHQAPLLAVYSALIFSGLLSFLIFNWSPAKVFMGDCASAFLGFTFAAIPLAFSSSTGTDAWLCINFSALMLFPFLFDGSFTLFRRAILILIEDGKFRIEKIHQLRGLMDAHRSHLYQRWTQNGKSHRFVSTMYGLWATVGTTAALLVYFEKISLFAAYPLVIVPGLALVTHSMKFGK